MKSVGRNEPCPCGSGKKYKHCHMKTQEHSSSNRKAIMYLILFIALIGLGITGYYMNKGNSSEGTVPGQVWSEEHQHWH